MTTQETIDRSAVAALLQSFEAMRPAIEELQQTCVAMRNAIVEAFKPLIRAIIRIYRQLRAVHLIPRQYRDTMMRRKIRRYTLAYARR